MFFLVRKNIIRCKPLLQKWQKISTNEAYLLNNCSRMILDGYKKQFAELLAKKTGLQYEEVFALIEQPPQTDMGDLAFPCFSLAKPLKKAPMVIAQEIAEGLQAE